MLIAVYIQVQNLIGLTIVSSKIESRVEHDYFFLAITGAGILARRGAISVSKYVWNSATLTLCSSSVSMPCSFCEAQVEVIGALKIPWSWFKAENSDFLAP